MEEVLDFSFFFVCRRSQYVGRVGWRDIEKG